MEKETNLNQNITRTISNFLLGQFSLKTNLPELRIITQDNTAVVKFKGLLSKAERELSKTVSGLEMVRKVYRELFDNNSPLLENMLRTSTGIEVRNIQVEIDPQYSESVLVINFKENIH